MTTGRRQTDMAKTERISLDEEGLGIFLSATERRIMEYIWSRGAGVTTTEIGAALGGVRISTVGALLDRLAASGLVCRTLDQSGTRLHYVYTSCCGREASQRALVDRVARALVRSFGHVAVAAFSTYVPPAGERKETPRSDAAASSPCTLFTDEAKLRRRSGPAPGRK